MAHSALRRRWESPPPEDTPPGAEPPKSPVGADPDKRKRILGAAVRTFGRRGFHEARIAEIAAAAKVAEGTVYLYFKNKEDLLGVVFDETMDDVLGVGREIARGEGSACERLVKLVDLHMSFLGSDRELASVFQIELRRSARLVERFSRSKLVEYFRMLESLLREGVEKGDFRKDLNPRLAVRIIFGAADELLSEWLLSGDTRPAATGEELVATLLLGFGCAPGATRAPAKAGKGKAK